jgi:hypothetical protein
LFSPDCGLPPHRLGELSVLLHPLQAEVKYSLAIYLAASFVYGCTMCSPAALDSGFLRADDVLHSSGRVIVSLSSGTAETDSTGSFHVHKL